MMRNNNKFPIFLFLLIFHLPMVCSGQDDDAIKQINSIKLSKDYLYAESTAESWTDAYNNAKKLLEYNIEEWAKQQGMVDGKSGILASSNEILLHIQAQRYEFVRAFVYVKISDLLQFEHSGQIVMVPALESKDDKVSSTVVKESVVELTAQNAEEAQTQSVETEPAQEVTAQVVLTDFERDFIEISKFAQVQEFVKGKMGAGIVTHFGKVATMPATGKIYLFVYNRDGLIEAHLRREAEGSFVNIDTNSNDNLDNYKGCGAFWIIENK